MVRRRAVDRGSLPGTIRYTRPTMIRSIALALLVAFALPACGLKGPLYLPGNPPASAKTSQDQKPAQDQKK